MKNPQPTNTHEVFHSASSIFFEPPKTKEQVKIECLRKAKVELISNIMEIRRKSGELPTGTAFNDLYDLDIDELHCEIIKAQDKAYFNRN